MQETKRTVGIFTLPLEFPCGAGSACCGPVGQTEEEVAAMKAAVEELSVEVEVYNVKKLEVLQQHPRVFAVLRAFGLAAVPILTVGDRVVAMGAASVEDAVAAIKENLVTA